MPDPVPQSQGSDGWIPISTQTPTVAAPTSDGWTPISAAPAKESFLPPSVMTPVDVAKGVGEGALKTAVGIGRIMNSPGGNIGAEQALNRGEELAKPNTQGEGFGQMVEEMAEWAAGDEALKGVTKLAAAPKGVLELMEKYPQASKMILGTMKGGAIGGAQGAAKAAGEGKSPVEGAEGGAVGGAIAGGASSALEDTGSFLGKKVGIGTTSLEDVQKALQPKKTDLAFNRDWERAAPTIGQKFRADGAPTSMGDAYKKIHDTADELWNTKVSGPIQVRSKDIPLEPLTNQPQNQDMIGDEVRKRVTDVIKEHFPKRAEFLNEFADRWGGHNPKTVGQINDEITQFNAELAAKDYWKATPEERAMMEKTDPEVAAYVAASDELRDVLFSHLKASGVPDIEEDRKLYGALQHIGGEARSRINVEGRKPGMSGKEFIGAVGGALTGGPKGAAVAAAPIIEKAANKPERVLARAAEKSLPETTGAKIDKAASKAALKTGEAAAGVAGQTAGRQTWVTFRGGDGTTYEGHPEDWEAIKKADPNAVEIKVQ
jgi:hypothetical protein